MFLPKAQSFFRSASIAATHCLTQTSNRQGPKGSVPENAILEQQSPVLRHPLGTHVLQLVLGQSMWYVGIVLGPGPARGSGRVAPAVGFVVRNQRRIC